MSRVPGDTTSAADSGRLLKFFCVIGVCCTALFLVNVKESPANMLGDSIKLKKAANGTDLKGVQVVGNPASATADEPVNKPQEVPKRPYTAADAPTFNEDPFQGVNMASMGEVQKVFADQREKYKERLREMYGDADRIFKDAIGRDLYDSAILAVSKGKPPAGKTLRGYDNFVRKFKIKLLQMQLNYIKQQKEKKSYRKSLIRYVWVNGGHSASAGHGNFFHESYTARMEQAVKPVLEAIGIDFEGRNYAMGGTPSAPEVALCSQAIFGKDVDTLTWDYGMLDSKVGFKMLLYIFRALYLAKLPAITDDGIRQRPAVVAFHMPNPQKHVLANLEEKGLTVMMARGAMGKVVDALPDMFGKNETQIAQIPEFARYFKCKGGLEKNDPGCGENKWNNTVCAKRHYRTGWHPGWKQHALEGNLMAITFLDIVEDAMAQLKEKEPEGGDETLDAAETRLKGMLKTLDAAEQKDYNAVLASEIPNKWDRDTGMINFINPQLEGFIDVATLYKTPVYCRTARLPSKSRYMGLLTEDYSLTTEHPESDAHFYDGTRFDRLLKVEKHPNETLREGYVDPKFPDQFVLMNSRAGWEECPDGQLEIDRKDNWLLTSLMGERKMTIPNDSELQYYNEFNATKSKGWLIICFTKCPWGKCEPANLFSTFAEGAWSTTYGYVNMTVNGEEVKKLHTMKAECFAAERKKPVDPKTKFVWTPNEKGQYEIRATIQAAKARSYIQFSSFILA